MRPDTFVFPPDRYSCQQCRDCPGCILVSGDGSNWRQVFDINLNGAMLCALSAPLTMQQKPGRIVNISSAGAFLGSICAHPAHGVAKAGLIAFTKSAAKEFAKDSIPVNAIAPGSIDTPMAESFVQPRWRHFFVVFPAQAPR
ncbi:MAG: SDR family oxidoreductase [Terriglobia bacterium]